MGSLTKRMMRGAWAAACVVVVCSFAGPSAAFLGECVDGRCAQMRRLPPPKVHHGAHDPRKQQGCCCEPPPGWGWYLRHKLQYDCSQPLVVFDELGGAVTVHENW